MKYRHFDPYRKEAEDAFWDRVKWARDHRRLVVDEAAKLRKDGHSIRGRQLRCKVKPVTLPKLGGE